MLRRSCVAAALIVTGLLALPALSNADTIGPFNFEPSSGYSIGNINGQNGWMKTGAYDANVAAVPVGAAAFGFGTQSLQISDAYTDGAFGGQTFSPGLANEAGETIADSGGPAVGTRQRHFEVNFSIGSAVPATLQTGLAMSMSPDRGDGGRMSYLRFEDHSNGIHVYFDDVTNVGPIGSVADFNESSIATLSRTQAHSVKLTIDFVDGPANDVVQVFIDGALKTTGTTWEDYYRFDPEQAGGGNKVPTVDKVLFAERGSGGNSGDLGKGFLIDNVGASSAPTPTTSVSGGTAGAGVAGVSKKKKCKKKKHAAVAKKKKCKKKKHKK